MINRKQNTGVDNSGDGNSGNWNSGDMNSGYRNSGNRNSGYFNTNSPKVRIFGRETSLAWNKLVFPDWFYFDLCVWVEQSDMTEEEKVTNDQYKATGGFLRVLDYKEAWRNAWNSVGDTEHRRVLGLPNFDNAIFLEITGIDVEEELNPNNEEKIEIDGKEYSVAEIKEALTANQQNG